MFNRTGVQSGFSKISVCVNNSGHKKCLIVAKCHHKSNVNIYKYNLLLENSFCSRKYVLPVKMT